MKGSNIKLILTRHEQGAGFMAATYGRLTGKPGVCLATLGPGATNFTTPTAYAQLGAIGHRSTSDENFKEILSKCLNVNGVHVIDLDVDYWLNHSILNVLLKEKTCIL